MKIKTISNFSLAALFALSMMPMTSCSDDNNDEPVIENGDAVNPGNVLEAGIPKSLGSSQILTNSKGQVVSIKDGSETISFEYGSFPVSRANNNVKYAVKMSINDSDYPMDGSDIYLQINKEGFVTYGYQVYRDENEEPEEWYFKYTDGHLTYMKRSEGDEVCTITYKDGDITKVYTKDIDGDYCENTIAYTNAAHPTVVPNKGCVMPFDAAFGIDMDEMGYAYYAGLLGKATKNLPMSNTEVSKEGDSVYNDTYVFNWTFNSDNLPLKLWEGENTYDTLTFTW